MEQIQDVTMKINRTNVPLLWRNIACLISTLLMCGLLAWLFSGCKSKTRTLYLPGETVVETRYVERTDTFKVEIPVPAQSASNVTIDSASHLETDVAESDAWLDSLGRLHHDLWNKPVNLPAEVPVKHVRQDSIVYKDRPVPYPVERELSRWEQMKLDYGGEAIVALVVVVIAAVAWLIRKFRK